jgi:hypothetical protein
MVEQLIRNVLLQHETRRLGITVTDQEVRDAAQTSPPPEVYSVPDFQTDGQFDPNKWRRFLQGGGANPELLLQLEQRYREQIPQAKLLQYITSDLYASDAKLWRVYRDQHDSVTIALLSIGPEQIADSDVSLGDAEIERYYNEHKSEFTRPASAWLSFLAVPRSPSATDTAAALARAERLRAEAATSQSKFEEVARRESSDTASGSQGGDLGWIRRTQQGFDPQFLAGLRGLPVGHVSRLTPSRFGYHLIRIDAAKGDSVHVRHILVPIELAGAHRDSVEALTDSLDRLVAERDSGWLLDSVARRFGLPVGTAPKLVEGSRMVLGRYAIPDVGVWAFERRPGETSPVIEGEAAYYVFRVDSADAGRGPATFGSAGPGGVPGTHRQEGRAVARAGGADRRGAPVRAVPARRGARAWPAGRAARCIHAPPSAADPAARAEGGGGRVRLRVGERSGALVGEHRAFLLESLARKLADSTAWLAQRDAQRRV